MRFVLLAKLALALLSFFLPCCDFSQAAEIAGNTSTGPRKLLKLTATKFPDNSAFTWDYDHANIDGRECGANLFLVGNPGTWKVTLTCYAIKDGKLLLERARVDVTFTGEAPPVAPPLPPPPGRVPGHIDPLAARLKIIFGHAGCTATVIWPRRPDGRWDVLTAAHCVSGGVGSKGTGRLPDGRVLPLTVAVREVKSDIAWLVTDQSYDDLPSAILAREVPPPGTPIWHQGYGVKNPDGNTKRTGSVLAGPDANGILWYQIPLSSGDSGSGIFRQDNSQVVATVYGVSGGRSLGGSAQRAWNLRPSGTWILKEGGLTEYPGDWLRVIPKGMTLWLEDAPRTLQAPLPPRPPRPAQSEWRPIPLPQLNLVPPRQLQAPRPPCPQ